MLPVCQPYPPQQRQLKTEGNKKRLLQEDTPKKRIDKIDLLCSFKNTLQLP